MPPTKSTPDGLTPQLWNAARMFLTVTAPPFAQLAGDRWDVSDFERVRNKLLKDFANHDGTLDWEKVRKWVAANESSGRVDTKARELRESTKRAIELLPERGEREWSTHLREQFNQVVDELKSHVENKPKVDVDKRGGVGFNQDYYELLGSFGFLERYPESYPQYIHDALALAEDATDVPRLEPAPREEAPFINIETKQSPYSHSFSRRPPGSASFQSLGARSAELLEPSLSARTRAIYQI